MTESAWERVWKNSEPDFEIVKRHSRSGRWQKIDKRVQNHFGSFKGLKVVELGSGRGTESLLMALNGADVSLIDNSRTALVKAKELFNSYNLEPVCYCQDITTLDKEFFSRYDISMSFGVVEHFLQKPERGKVLRLHYDVLKPGGLFFVSVPNKMCPHYRLALYLGRVVTGIHKGPPGTEEDPFTRDELTNYAKYSDVKHVEIFGSSFFDFSYNPIFKFINLGSIGLSFFDDYLAYALVLSGTKSL